MLSVWLLMLAFLASLSVVNGTYMIVFPNSLIPGIPLRVQVLVQNSTGPVSVWVGLKFEGNNTLVSQDETSVQIGTPTTLSLEVPGNLQPSAYKLEAYGSHNSQHLFENRSNIRFEDKSLMVFIQTDKTRYSAGQTVQYRAVLLLPNLLNFKGEATITIKDGKGNKIEVRGPELVNNGVISGHIELSRYPVFGTWNIVVDALGKSTTKQFEVNDYILPKFTVQISIPEEIDHTQESFTVDIKAMFTFNTDVIGNCTIILYNVEESWNNFNQSAELRGSTAFHVQMSKVDSELDVDSKINIRAMVTDHATALTMVAEKTLTFEQNNEDLVTISKVYQYKNSYIPGMTSHTKLFVGRNGQPLGQGGVLTVTPTVTTAVLKICSYGTRYTWLDVQEVKKTTFTIPFDESGYADLSYFDNTGNAEKISFQIKFNDPTIQSKSSYLTVVLYALSSSMPLLRINGNKVKASVGESIDIDVATTENLSGNLVFEIYSRGILIGSEQVTISNVRSKTHSILATKDMIPRANILVHHVTQSGYLIADYLYIDVEGNPLNNDVQVSYNATLLQPGQSINMHIQADPFSTVYVLVEDMKNRLLGTDNDIFRTDVDKIIKDINFSASQNVQNFKNLNRRKRFIQKRQTKLTKRSHGTLGDLDDVYIESGLIILSDAHVLEEKIDLLSNQNYKRTCEKPTTTPAPSRGGWFWRRSRRRSGNLLWTAPAPDLGAAIPQDNWNSNGLSEHENPPGDWNSNDLFEHENPPELSLEEIVRSRFPETWIWDDYNVGSTGLINVANIVPDSMTTWVTSVFAMNTDTGFGISAVKPEFTVKKMFFLTMDLPPAIVHGEEFLLQITAFNNYPVLQQVFLLITLSEDPYNPIPASTIVKPYEGHSTYIHVTPKLRGVLNVTVMARIGFFSTGVADILMKSVTVMPNGVFKTVNEQHLIDVNSEDDPVTKTIVLEDPENMVEGTKVTKITITGNFMVPSIEGLGNLIRMPYGCGEQTMLNFAPGIYITKYLEAVGKLTAEIQDKSMKSLKEGLQRELRYQHHDGSFSAFGNRDPSGSSWLTAFVLKCFGQAKGLIQIDDSIMYRAMVWLLAYQKVDGSFSEPGRVIHTSMQAGTASGIKMTAFILISLLENKNSTSFQGLMLNNGITSGRTYLEAKLNTATDAYTLAIVCYALASAGSSSGSSCFTKLKNAAIIDDGKIYWKATSTISKREVVGRTLVNRAPSADIEATSYALLAFMKLGRISEVFPIVKWLVSQRNPTGGCRSTQDTVISLQALSEFSSSGGSGPGPDYGVHFNFESFAQTYSTTHQTFDVVHTIEVPTTVDAIVFQMTGMGSAVIDVTSSYYVTGNEVDDYIALDVTITKETINTATVKACVSWTGPVLSGMLLMEVEMPTGFQPDNDVLKSQDVIKQHETNGRNIAIYLDGLNPNGKVCSDVKIDRKDPVVKSQACHVKAYDYYNPDHQTIQRYEFGIIKEANICTVCPLCRFCMSNGSGGQSGIGK